MRNQKSMLIFFSLSIFYFSASSFAGSAKINNEMSYGRYLTLKVNPTHEQVDIFSAVIQVSFSPKIKTVGEAISEILRYTGYSLVDNTKQIRELQETLKKPLPFIQRNFGPLTLRQILNLLIGSPYILRIDPLNRIIDFELKTEFQR